jgi:pyrroline-5-carboxylate reductase
LTPLRARESMWGMTKAAALQIGFIGAGRMATALAKGLVRAQCASPDSITASDVEAAAREHFVRETGCAASASNVDTVRHARIVVLAVKPQSMPAVLQELKPLLGPEQLVISIAAGVTLATLADALGAQRRLVRVMPNTPCLVGKGASGFSLGGAATPDDGGLVERLLSTVGIAVQLPERLLDAVTGLSGSGPAYAFQVIEALSDGGVRVGLPRDVATRLAAQTLLGAAEMVLTTGQHPAALKDAVASPGGTTIAGLHALEQSAMRAGLINAVVAATERSQELGRS